MQSTHEKTNQVSSGWKTIAIVFIIISVVLMARVASIPGDQTTAAARTTQQSQTNQQNLQNCIQAAQDQYERPGSGLVPSVASTLDAAVNACKAQYPVQ